MKRPAVTRLLLVLSIMSLAVVACLGTGTREVAPNSPVADSPAEAENIDTAPVEEANDPQTEDQTADDQGAADSDAAADESDMSPSDPDRGLEATDPATVQLATGIPQLIEFFSYT